MQIRYERPVDEHISKGTKHCFMKIAAAERLAKGLYKGFVENIIRSIGDALELVLYDCGDVPWSPNTVWEMMVVHPIAEDWRRRGHASEYSEPQLLIELAEKQTETELKEKLTTAVQCSTVEAEGPTRSWER